MQIEILNVAEVTPETLEQKLVFDRFKKEQAAVYEILCPSKKHIRNDLILDRVEMPDRCVELVKLTQDRFKYYSIWESENYEIKDPILIGHKLKDENSAHDADKGFYAWYYDDYLLARWGKELNSFEELKKKAISVMVKSLKVTALKTKSLCEMFLADPELFVSSALDKGENNSFNFEPGFLRN